LEAKSDTLLLPDVLFMSGKKTLQPKMAVVLDSFCNSMKGKLIDSLVVEGHTDSTGTIAANRQLSLNRASSETNYLQQFFHTVIQTRGWASERPVGDNRTREGRRKNRRVEIYLYIRE
jgi:outer membrane protein OmpA-like peptidoglycan-associated protein